MTVLHSAPKGCVLYSLAGRFMGSALRPFREDYSEVECTVHERKHWDVLEGLYDGVAKLAIVCWPCLDPLLTDLDLTPCCTCAIP